MSNVIFPIAYEGNFEIFKIFQKSKAWFCGEPRLLSTPTGIPSTMNSSGGGVNGASLGGAQKDLGDLSKMLIINLNDRHYIRQYLTRMLQIRKSIYYRYICIFGYILYSFMRVRSHHDSIRHTG